MIPYPTKKPAKCNNRTESITFPSSPDKILWSPTSGPEPEPADVLRINDLRRTTFSENILIKGKRRLNVKVIQVERQHGKYIEFKLRNVQFIVFSVSRARLHGSVSQTKEMTGPTIHGPCTKGCKRKIPTIQAMVSFSVECKLFLYFLSQILTIHCWPSVENYGIPLWDFSSLCHYCLAMSPWNIILTILIIEMWCPVV